MSVLSLPFSGELFGLPTNERKLSESSFRYASLLAIVSLVLMIEGTIRFVSYKAAADPIEMSRLEYRAIVGGSFEIFFGGMGFVVGTSVLNFDFHWRDFTGLTLVVQAKTALVFGYILGSTSLCALLQSLQLMCTAGLLSVQATSSPLSSQFLFGYAVWAIGLVFLFGFSTLVFGVQVLSEEGAGRFEEGAVFVFPPHVVMYPGHTVASGVLVTVQSSLLAASMWAYKMMIPFACLGGIVTWIWLISGEVMTQVSLAAADSATAEAWAAPAAQLVGLYIVLMFGPLFVLGELQRERQHEEEADVSAQEFQPDVVKLSGDQQFEGARCAVGGL